MAKENKWNLRGGGGKTQRNQKFGEQLGKMRIKGEKKWHKKNYKKIVLEFSSTIKVIFHGK